ncbi:MAG TPA: class I SAM-dependent methyltransferase [Chitinophagaceae bacterium]|nr:class I SAM-dependent methyltransferase [Chitinophagaceae bacterium]
MSNIYDTPTQTLFAAGSDNFEKLYTDVRKKEKRLYSLHQVAALPDVKPSHVHYDEWKIRKRSSKRLIYYLKKKNKHLKVLEIGCGNGWLSNKIAYHVDAEVVGIDVNKIELGQARTIWSHKIDLDFIYGDIRDNIFKQDHFDIIVFAASIQYFSPLKEILPVALSLLNTDGEIHIMDTKFYKERQIPEAIERSNKYYYELGHPEMMAYYFHHSWADLKNFNYTILSNPFSLVNRFFNYKNIFPWIKIRR